MTFQKLNNSNGQSALAGLCTNLGSLQSKNNSDCRQSVFSNQSSLLIGPIGFLISSKLFSLVDCLKAYGRFDF